MRRSEDIDEDDSVLHVILIMINSRGSRDECDMLKLEPGRLRNYYACGHHRPDFEVGEKRAKVGYPRYF